MCGKKPPYAHRAYHSVFPYTKHVRDARPASKLSPSSSLPVSIKTSNRVPHLIRRDTDEATAGGATWGKASESLERKERENSTTPEPASYRPWRDRRRHPPKLRLSLLVAEVVVTPLPC